MKDEIRQAFDAIHAPEELKADTKRALRARLHRHSAALPRTGALRVCAAAACVLALLVLGGYRFYFTPTSIISIDINPSLELTVNRFDRVIDAEGYNEDGVALADSLHLLNLPYQQAVDRVLESETVTDCLARQELLSIAVTQGDPGQGREILDYVSACTAGNPNAMCYGMGAEDAEQAHALGLSCGKYRAYLELQAQGIELAPEQVAEMTMRQIQALLQDGSAGNGGAGRPQGQGNGNRYRWANSR